MKITTAGNGPPSSGCTMNVSMRPSRVAISVMDSIIAGAAVRSCLVKLDVRRADHRLPPRPVARHRLGQAARRPAEDAQSGLREMPLGLLRPQVVVDGA